MPLPARLRFFNHAVALDPSGSEPNSTTNACVQTLSARTGGNPTETRNTVREIPPFTGGPPPLPAGPSHSLPLSVFTSKVWFFKFDSEPPSISVLSTFDLTPETPTNSPLNSRNNGNNNAGS